MNKILKYKSFFMLLVCITAGCSKSPDIVISDQINQAFIQGITVQNTAWVDVTSTGGTNIPATVIDVKTGIERLSVAGTPLTITVTVKAGTDLTKLYVRSLLSSQSKFATVSPAMGVVGDFSTPKTYTLTSQTGKNVNVYTLKIVSL
jgi:hypothetical protein